MATYTILAPARPGQLHCGCVTERRDSTGALGLYAVVACSRCGGSGYADAAVAQQREAFVAAMDASPPLPAGEQECARHGVWCVPGPCPGCRYEARVADLLSPSLRLVRGEQ